MSYNKYRARKTKIGSESFDSMREAQRYQELLLLQRAGKIRTLSRQVKYELIPKQDGERACSYIADFVYHDVDTGETIVEDVKGVRTDVYKIKRKLMLWIHNIRIKEI